MNPIGYQMETLTTYIEKLQKEAALRDLMIAFTLGTERDGNVTDRVTTWLTAEKLVMERIVRELSQLN